jgi:hypothetical protein
VSEPSRPDSEDTVERREESAQHVLNSFRERRRRRRGEDTFFGSVDLLLDSERENPGERELERRRSEIMEEAEEVGMPSDLAELLYDVALEEGIDPTVAFDLVRSGLGVAPPEGREQRPERPDDRQVSAVLDVPAANRPTGCSGSGCSDFSFRRLRSLLMEEDARGRRRSPVCQRARRRSLWVLMLAAVGTPGGYGRRAPPLAHDDARAGP